MTKNNKTIEYTPFNNTLYKCNLCKLNHNSDKDPYYNVAAIILIVGSISYLSYYLKLNNLIIRNFG